MTEKRRIGNIIKSEPSDRIGIFDLDIALYPEANQKQTDRFFIFSFNGPFQHMSLERGLENALVELTREPRHALALFSDCQKKITADYKRLKDEGYEFDAAWIWEDIAYSDGLYFSTGQYGKNLQPAERDLSDFFRAEGLNVFFHCDGNVEMLIPLLADMKVDAIHPLEEASNPNILKIKQEMRGVMTFIGGVGFHRVGKEKEALRERIDMLKDGGNYIFSLDGPAPESFSKEEHEALLRDVELFGAYR